MSTYNLPKFGGLNVGDETRRHGDYVGLPHTVSDGTAVADLGSLDRGVPVNLDGSGNLQAASSGGSVVGVLYAFDVYGDSSRDGPYVDGDSDATVKTSGTVIADVASMVSSGISAGDVLGANGELVVLEVLESDGGSTEIAEVLLR
jgi:hypothetical protein